MNSPHQTPSKATFSHAHAHLTNPPTPTTDDGGPYQTNPSQYPFPTSTSNTDTNQSTNHLINSTTNTSTPSAPGSWNTKASRTEMEREAKKLKDSGFNTMRYGDPVLRSGA